MKIWMTLFSILVLSGCLQTRETMEDGGEERSTLREQMKALQAKSAQHELRVNELLAEIRRLNGRVEEFNSTEPDGTPPSDELEQLKSRLKVYDEALQKMDQEIQTLKRGRQGSATPPASSAVPAGDLAAGDHYFEKKSWSESIRAYENYRRKNPTGKNYSKATLRIALAFQSMGMNKEAKAFFQEVTDQYPKSDEARIATSRLSQL